MGFLLSAGASNVLPGRGDWGRLSMPWRTLAPDIPYAGTLARNPVESKR